MNKINLYPRLWSLLLLLLCAVAIKAQTYTLEYWFDKYSSPKTSSFTGTKFNKTIDAKSLNQGIHTMYMRVKASDGTYSPVTSSMFIKFAASSSGESKLEYWFDSDMSNLESTTIDINSDVVQILDLDMTDTEKFPLGVHQLNMRVAAYGGHYSPVYSAYVMRLPSAQATQIIYWLDDDYKNRSVLKGNAVNATTIVFDTQLNLSNAPIGMHRLKYRVTYNGFDDGVVYEVPVLITKKYNSMGVVTVVGESHWLDEASPAEYAISNPNSIVTRSYTLDPAHYTVGQHAFHVQYKNSSDVWSEQNVTYFYKEESGRLRAGIYPGDDVPDGIDDAAVGEFFICASEKGLIYVDCQSSRLATTGIVQVYDMTGKMVAQQSVNNSDGIHAEINVEGYTKQILIVRLICGEVVFNKKLVVQ